MKNCQPRTWLHESNKLTNLINATHQDHDHTCYAVLTAINNIIHTYFASLCVTIDLKDWIGLLVNCMRRRVLFIIHFITIFRGVRLSCLYMQTVHIYCIHIFRTESEHKFIIIYSIKKFKYMSNFHFFDILVIYWLRPRKA